MIGGTVEEGVPHTTGGVVEREGGLAGRITWLEGGGVMRGFCEGGMVEMTGGVKCGMSESEGGVSCEGRGR